MHVALTPTWSETAWFADYILPMGLGTERHDTMSQETHAGRWLGFRQPVAARRAREARRDGRRARTKPIPAKSGRSPSSGSRSPGRSIPTARSASASSSSRRTGPASRSRWTSTTAGCSRTRCRACRKRRRRKTSRRCSTCGKYGVFQVRTRRYSRWHERRRAARRAGRVEDGAAASSSTASARAGFNTPSRKLEFYSPTLADWGWPEHAIPRYVPGHVHWRDLEARGGRVRSAAELPAADAHPHALAGEVALRDLAQQPAVDRDRRTRDSSASSRAISSRCGRGIGYFVTRAWVTEGIRPGVVGMSHHLGRWRLNEEIGRRARRRRAGDDRRARARPLRDAAGPRRAAVREQRSRQRAHLVERGRRAPEPHVPGAARSGERHALLAPARDAREGRARTIATATSSSTPNEVARGSIRSGWRRRGRRRAPTARGGPCGSIGRCGR